MKTTTPEVTPPIDKNILITAGVLAIVLFAATFLAYEHAKTRTPTVILPNGATYLGPSPGANGAPSSGQTQQTAPTTDSGTISVPADAKWTTYKGKLLPYTFLYPETLNLGVFPGDPFDSVTIFWQNTNPQVNIFFRVEDLNKIANMSSFVNKPKKDYVLVWWKQYIWKGVADITEFTNSYGLKGYRAKYLDSKGDVPYDHVFFEVPGSPNRVIWMASSLLSPQIFDRIVDSVAWKK